MGSVYNQAMFDWCINSTNVTLTFGALIKYNGNKPQDMLVLGLIHVQHTTIQRKIY